MGGEFRGDPVLAAVEVDLADSGLRALRDELQSWAERQLRERECELGLYVAEFAAWSSADPLDEEGAQSALSQAYFVRALYLVWSGESLIGVDVEDSPKALRAVA